MAEDWDIYYLMETPRKPITPVASPFPSKFALANSKYGHDLIGDGIIILCDEKSERLVFRIFLVDLPRLPFWITSINMAKNEKTWRDYPNIFEHFREQIKPEVLAEYARKLPSQPNSITLVSDSQGSFDYESDPRSRFSGPFNFKARNQIESDVFKSIPKRDDSLDSYPRDQKDKEKAWGNSKKSSNGADTTPSWRRSPKKSQKSLNPPDQDPGKRGKKAQKGPLLNVSRSTNDPTRILVSSNVPEPAQSDSKNEKTRKPGAPLVNLGVVTNCGTCGCSEQKCGPGSKICRNCWHQHT